MDALGAWSAKGSGKLPHRSVLPPAERPTRLRQFRSSGPTRTFDARNGPCPISNGKELATIGRESFVSVTALALVALRSSPCARSMVSGSPLSSPWKAREPRRLGADLSHCSAGQSCCEQAQLGDGMDRRRPRAPRL